MINPNASRKIVPESFIRKADVRRRLRPAVPIHGEVERFSGDVHSVAVRVHDLARSTGGLAKTFLPPRDPLRLDRVALGIQEGLLVTFNKQGKRQHVAVDGLMTDAFACLTLHVR